MATQDFRVHEKVSKPLGVPIRRRRFAIFTVLLLGLIFFIYVPWELPAGVKDTGISSISRANVAQLVRSTPVDELYGLLHLVSGGNLGATTSDLQLNPYDANDIDLYAPGERKINWGKEKSRIDKEYPLVVFSKTYCPYSRRAKELLASYNLQPPPKIIEVDLREDGTEMKQFLTRLTQHSTFPNIILRGKSLGGSDALQALHAKKALKKLLKEAGVTSKKSIKA